MRDLNSAEQCVVSGGMTAPLELTGWVPDSVLFAFRTGEGVKGPGAVGIGGGFGLGGSIEGPGFLNLGASVFTPLPLWEC